MWIRSQNKDLLINTNRIGVFDYGFGEYLIRGDAFELGIYSTKEKALEILDEIHCSLNNGATNVYQMPQDEDVEA